MNIRTNLPNYICRNVTELPSYMFVKFIVPKSDEILAGEFYVAENLNEELGYGNWDVYQLDKFSNENEVPAIILNGNFETLSDGRRPNGQPDYTQYKFIGEDVASAIRLLPEIKFELSIDILDNLEDFKAALSDGIENTYIYPELNSNKFKWTKNLEDINTKTYMVIESLKYFRLGGLFGSDFAQTIIVRVKNKTIEKEPEITALNIDVVEDINVPTEVGTKVADLSVSGGTEPFVYSLPVSTGDNDMFEVSNNTILVKTKLEELKTYNITVEVTDSNEKSKTNTANIETTSSPITDINFSITDGLQAGNPNTASGAIVGTMNAQGGNAPYTYSLNEGGADNSSFVIDGNNIKVGSSSLSYKEYQISIKVVDKYNKVYIKNSNISVLPPEITAINAEVTPKLQVGNENVNSGATVMTMSIEGGTLPVSYEFVENAESGIDNASFVIEDNKVNVGTDALKEAKTYKVYIKATDSLGKTFEKGFDIVVSE